MSVIFNGTIKRTEWGTSGKRATFESSLGLRRGRQRCFNQIRRLSSVGGMRICRCLGEASKLFSINSSRLSHQARLWFQRHTILLTFLFRKASSLNYGENIIIVIPHFPPPAPFTDWQFFSPLHEIMPGTFHTERRRGIEWNYNLRRHIYNYLSLLWKIIIL